MRLASLARRSLAVTAVTTLLTTGVALTPAYAVGPVAAPTPSSASPAAVQNTGNPKVVLTGTGFNPATDSIRLIPTFPGGGGNLVGYVDNSVTTNSSTQLTVILGATDPVDLASGDTLDATAPAAPGAYDIAVDGSSLEGTGTCGRACLSLVQGTAPFAISTAQDTATGHKSSGDLTVTGKNIAFGAKVTALLPDGKTIDPYLAFTSTRGTATGSVYSGGTTMYASYVASTGFSPGKHLLRITNTDGQSALGSAEFWQPSISTVSPNRLGQGAATTVTVTGPGAGTFRAGSRIGISTAANGDLSVGATTVSADGSSLSAPVTVTATSAAGARTVSVSSPDGAYTVLANGITIATKPVVSCVTVKTATNCPTIASTFEIGQGATGVEAKVIGTGLFSGPPTTAFTFGGNGLTATVVDGSVAVDGTSARILLTATPTAVTGARQVTATNPDFGSSTLGNSPAGTPPVQVNAAPVVTAPLTPLSSPANTSLPITIKGTGFKSGMTAVFAAPDGSTNKFLVTSATVTAGTGGNPDTLSLQVTIANGAPAGPYDVILTNLDAGTTTCTACFKVDSLSVDPSTNAGTNSQSAKVVKLTGSGLPASGTVTLSRSTPLADQPTITAGSYVGDASGAFGNATFDLTTAAPGPYDVRLTSGSQVLFCTACFTITAPTPSVTSITNTTTSTSQVGQGASGVPLAIVGSSFSRGMQVTATGLTFTNVTYVDSQHLTATVAVAPGATTGSTTVTVANADAAPVTSSNSGTGTLTVNPGPKPSSIAPATKGQGGTAQTVTITGPGFVTGSTVDLGPGITITNTKVTDNPGTLANANPDDQIVLTFDVSPGATVGARDVVITNPDSGRGLIAKGFTVTVGPKPTGISPSQLKPGDSATITIVGTGFAADATPTLTRNGSDAPITLSNVTVNDSGSITATVAVDPAAALGPVDVVVTNTSDSGSGLCLGCLSIVGLPSTPQNVAATPGTRSATVTWDPPSTNGGAAVTSYTVSDGVDAPVSVDAGADRTYTFTNLTAAQAYTFTVAANNSVGASATGSATATPYDVPLPPTAVSATSGNGQVTVTFSGADPRGSDINEYTIQLSNGAGSVYQATAGSPMTVGGLVNGTRYTITVAARNAAGYGAYSTASATATPAYPSRLTATASPLVATARQAVTYSGRLTRTDGTPIAGAIVAVGLTPEVGAGRVVNVRTGADGTWSFRIAATYNTTVRATYAGDSGSSAVSAAAFRVLVRTLVVRTAPTTGQTTPASTTVQVKGTTSPNKAGRTIGLYRGSTLVAKAAVRSDGTFVINTRLARGTYTLFIQIGTTAGNITGRTGSFVMKRN